MFAGMGPEPAGGRGSSAIFSMAAGAGAAPWPATTLGAPPPFAVGMLPRVVAGGGACAGWLVSHTEAGGLAVAAFASVAGAAAGAAVPGATGMAAFVPGGGIVPAGPATTFGIAVPGANAGPRTSDTE